MQVLNRTLLGENEKKWGKKTEGYDFGDELDCLAIGPNKELVCIELKHASNVSGIYWGPLQASVYRDAFSAQLDSISESIKTMVKQKIDLGLLPPEAKGRLPEGTFIEVLGVLAVAGDINKKSVCWEKAIIVNSHPQMTIKPQTMVRSSDGLNWEGSPNWK